MRHTAIVIVLAVTSLGAGSRVDADVIIRLHNGGEYRATHYWIESGLVTFEHRGGMVGLPREAVAEIVKAAPPKPAPPAGASTASGTAALPAPAVANATADDAAARVNAPAGPPMENGATPPRVDIEVPAEVKGEDLETRMNRLDDLSLTAYREISMARTRGAPQATLDALQAKIYEINRQRAETMRRLGTLR